MNQTLHDMKFESGEHKIKGLYWEIRADENNKMYASFKDEFGYDIIRIDKLMNLNEFIPMVLQILNKHLSQYMKDKHVKRFFPIRSLSYDIINDTFEICYYQNKRMYDMVFSKFDQNVVLEPNNVVMSEIDTYYQSYNLNPYDKILFNY